ncbi:MAG: HAMP domain-containing sensor histidine kinase [Bdellovibrionota bacterium]
MDSLATPDLQTPSIEKLEELSETEKLRVSSHRFFMMHFVAIFVYPSWGVVYYFLAPHAQTFEGFRVLNTLWLMFAAYCLRKYGSKTSLDRQYALVCTSAILITLHTTVMSTVAKNDLSFSIANLVTFFIMGILLDRPRVFIFYNVFMLGFLAVINFAYAWTDSVFPVPVMLITYVTFSGVGYVGLRDRMRYLLRLEELSRTVVYQAKLLDIEREKLFQTAKFASLGEMAGGIAHEINNPLTILQGTVYIFEKKLRSLGAQGSEYLPQIEKMGSTIERIAQIVLGVKKFSRDGSSDPFEVFDLVAMVRESLAFVESNLRTQDIDVQLVGLDEPIKIRGQSVAISQVLVNLLNNSSYAIKDFSDKWIKVELELKLDQHKVRLSVEDCGLGISTAVKEKIFEPFFTSKPPGDGTGLGLSICRTVIKQHDGNLFVDDSSPHTKFVIEIPLQSGNQEVA